GFEPLVGCPTTVFKTVTFGRSVSPPHRGRAAAGPVYVPTGRTLRHITGSCTKMAAMRAITITPDQTLELSEAPAPVAGPGEVVLDVVAAGVNRADVLQRQGHYTPPPGASETIGLEVSGTVREVGTTVEGWRPGDEACALLAAVGYGGQLAVPAGQLLPVPAGLVLVAAAALPEAACAAWSNLVDVGGLAEGETLLVHGGSGGVGSLAIQLARA